MRVSASLTAILFNIGRGKEVDRFSRRFYLRCVPGSSRSQTRSPPLRADSESGGRWSRADFPGLTPSCAGRQEAARSSPQRPSSTENMPVSSQGLVFSTRFRSAQVLPD
ncbi:unnamed protein product [Pleuronectes platessa]|uniref:Uncharacterized protein n=1 Tax=Pleuronectes platessa TaxID=8262 RepID=A0A9N7UK63_PLEPL|nr:unnamed protein product [Pleuronectes platessa]